MQMCSNHNVLDGGHVHANLKVLKSESYAYGCQYRGRYAMDRLAPKVDRTLIGKINSRYQVEERSFASAVGANYRINTSFLYRKTYVLDRFYAAERFGYVGCFKQCHN